MRDMEVTSKGYTVAQPWAFCAARWGRTLGLHPVVLWVPCNAHLSPGMTWTVPFGGVEGNSKQDTSLNRKH